MAAHHRGASRRWMGGERQACRADMGAGGDESATEVAEEKPALVERRFVHPPAAGAPEPCLVLRRRRGQDPRRTEIPHAQPDRRVHPRMPGDPDRPQAELHRRHRRPVGPVHPPRHPWPYPLGPWPRVHRQGRAGVDCRRWRPRRVHRAGIALGERLLRELSTRSSATSY